MRRLLDPVRAWVAAVVQAVQQLLRSLLGSRPPMKFPEPKDEEPTGEHPPVPPPPGPPKEVPPPPPPPAPVPPAPSSEPPGEEVEPPAYDVPPPPAPEPPPIPHQPTPVQAEPPAEPEAVPANGGGGTPKGGDLSWTVDVPPAPEPVEPPDPPAPPNRYANAVLSDRSGRRLDADRPLEPETVLRLTLSIGPLDRASHVSDHTPFPDKVLPRKDVELDVVVSSADFAVGITEGELDRPNRAVKDTFVVPADGAPARTPEGAEHIEFLLRSPATSGTQARARIAYYYRDAPVQSQVLIADVGTTGGRFTITTDYTASAVLDDLDGIPDTPRLSMITNTDPAGTHGIALRPAGGSPADTTAFSLPDDTIGKMMSTLRSTLSDRASGDRRRNKKDLVQDLRELAPLGQQLYQQLFVQARDVVGALRMASPRPIVHIARPRNVRFTVPWNYLYEIALPADVSKVPVCPLVTEWDEKAPMVAGPSAECPRAGDVAHTENLLCPFGFWGFSQMVEAPASTKDTTASIPFAPKAVVAVGESTKVDLDALAAHVGRLQSLFQARFADVDVRRGDTKQEILDLLSADLPIVYFYCHGDKDRTGSPDTWLSVGAKEQLTAGELINLFSTSFARHKVLWDKVRPLVVINACHSLEISPATLVSYVDAFVGGGNAMGVIGTEVKIPQTLAMEWADAFFTAFLAPDGTAGSALQAARFQFLASGNLFGLVYTAHCWAHLAVTGP